MKTAISLLAVAHNNFCHYATPQNKGIQNIVEYKNNIEGINPITAVMYMIQVNGNLAITGKWKNVRSQISPRLILVGKRLM